MKVPRTQTYRVAPHVPRWRLGGLSVEGASGYNTENLAVDHSRQLVLRVPCDLTTTFVDFEKEQALCSRWKKLPNSPYYFNGSQKLLTRLSHPSLIVFIFCWTEYCWNIVRWTLSNNQSINLQLPRKYKHFFNQYNFRIPLKQIKQNLYYFMVVNYGD